MKDEDIRIQYEIEQFLYQESHLLDSNRQGEWLDLLHDEFVYRLPVPVAREEPSQPQHDPVLEYANESKSFLSMRFHRIDSDFAWAERPSAYVRHFVSNVQVETEVEGRAWTVSSNVLVSRSRLPDPPSVASARRVDRIVRQGERLLLRERVVYLDTEVPTDSQLGSIF
ncbi:aromatic-ring-hydroxylating dioxygenase subunit beta [Ornithinimicrobium sufpigmenti]|uniref:aromatic-ring-hydroxylating dioxygenase subunit beta n=1 Tax=Ornithinimicrobium sufpigmenti TaxID=2508882 RepID=UPI0010362E66|nr:MULTISPECIES: aromatic-ring-hydroxylating dioxygenase subunit beta [unclassified Ornithinimicrobium]